MSENEAKEFIYDKNITQLPVVLVDNGQFRAAGVMFNERERNSWLQCFANGDPRPRTFWIIDIAKLKKLMPNDPYLIEY
jgi:hypothetical protein